MNLLLFERAGKDFFVTGERQHRSTAPENPKTGTLEKLKYQVRSAYEKLRQKFDYQENVCSTLRHAEVLKLIHPEKVDRREAAERLALFLSHRSRKHRRWMIIDGVLALLGSLLTPIPGPNVFFLYPAVRALSHYLALRGVHRAEKIKQVTFETESVLDQIQMNMEHLDKVEEQIRELEGRFDLRGLKSLLSS